MLDTTPLKEGVDAAITALIDGHTKMLGSTALGIDDLDEGLSQDAIDVYNVLMQLKKTIRNVEQIRKDSNELFACN